MTKQFQLLADWMSEHGRCVAIYKLDPDNPRSLICFTLKQQLGVDCSLSCGFLVEDDTPFTKFEEVFNKAQDFIAHLRKIKQKE